MLQLEKDTVSADEEDDEVDADHDAREGRPSVGNDAVIHDRVPIFSCQDLETGKHSRVQQNSLA